jgi:phosphoribosylformylglycinamidine cyclo-ligase
MSLDAHIPELGRTLGEELLEPTLIYVKEVFNVIDNGIDVKALVHITSDGFMNLARVDAQVGFVLDTIPEPPPIFRLIQEHGNVPIEEMYAVYNMGIGFCVVVRPDDVQKTLQLLKSKRVKASVIGKAVHDENKAVKLPQQGIVGSGNQFTKMF